MQKLFVYSSLFLILFGGVSSLRDVRILVEPSLIIRGGTAAIICSRDMQGAPLYSVKWYRGTHEFYRFTPKEDPPTRQFSIAGMYVDMKRSNGTHAVLRKMDLGLAGNFKCEVTADEPYFSTQIVEKFVDVVALPIHGPILMADKDHYQPGEVLRANCSHSPSRPAANLTIYVNEEQLPASQITLHQSESGLQWSSVNAELMVAAGLFPGGRLRLTCVATVYEVYRSSAKLDFFTPEADPRPERITLGSATKHYQSWTLILLIFLATGLRTLGLQSHF